VSHVGPRSNPPRHRSRGGKIASLGLRPYAVVIRRRRWSGARVGDGTATNTDTVLTPTPKVTDLPASALGSGILTSGGTIEDRYFAIERITPSYVDPRDGQRKGLPAWRPAPVGDGAERGGADRAHRGRRARARLHAGIAGLSKPFRYQLVVRLKRQDT
jgi:hypothetical protein